MYKHKRSSARLIFLLLLTFTILHMVHPTYTYAEENLENEKESQQLFKLSEDIVLADGITILKDTFLYGIQEDERVKIQFRDTYKEIPYSAVSEVQEKLPIYNQAMNVATLKTISSNTILFDYKDVSSIRINSSIDYPVYQNEVGENVIYIGNQPFSFTEEVVEEQFAENAQDEKQVEKDDPKESLEDENETSTNDPKTNEDTSKKSTELEVVEDEVIVDSDSQLEQDQDHNDVKLEDGKHEIDEEDAELELNEEPKVEVDISDSADEKNGVELEKNSALSVENKTQLIRPMSLAMSVSTLKADPWAGVTSNYFKVTTDQLTVYDNRGSGPLKPVGSLEKGQVYPIIREYGNWHQIQFGDFYGFVRKSETIPDNGSSLKNKNKSYKNQSRTFQPLINVAVYDNTSGSLVPFGTINKGQSYTISNDYGGNWWRVLFAGRVGYVRKNHVKTDFQQGDKYFRVYKDRLPVYDNRGSGPLKKVGELKKGDAYSIVSDYGKNWWRVQFGDIYGYVRKADTGYATSTEIPNLDNGSKNTAHKFVSKKQITVYDNTSGKLVPFGKIDKGQIFPIELDYGSKWWRISFLDRTGYVKKSEVDFQFANFNRYFKADKDLTVYDNRGSGPLKPVGKLQKDETYSIVTDYGNWHRIQFGNIYGYVSKFDTRPSNASSVKNLNKNYKNQSRTFKTLQDVTIYDNTSGRLVPFASINKNQDYAISTDYGSNWWRVLFGDRVGYVRKDEVKAEFQPGDQYFRVYTDNLPVYDNRGSGPLKKVGELEKGKAYTIVSDYGKNWWRVQFGDIYGYVSKADTGYATSSEIPNLDTSNSQSDRKFITKEQVVVYDNTSGKLVPIGKIDKDFLYPIVTDNTNWWKINYLGQIGYVDKDSVNLYGIIKTHYNLKLSQALAMQMKASPQTDTSYAYVSKTYIENNRVTASTLNVRTGPGTKYDAIGYLSNGAYVTIVGEKNGWYQIKYSYGKWVDASSTDVLYYLDPTNFTDNSRQKFQFLDLSKASDATVTQLNSYLSGKGTLSGQGKAFKDASRIHGVNDIYLVSHAILETGHGSSTLAQGVMYNGVKVYNMYGVGAYDRCPIECGAQKAYEEGWTTPYKAIVGGAKFIGNSYIKVGQNTLYKMRWNPQGMQDYGYATHQYATDIGWAYKQVGTIYNLYRDLQIDNLYLDIPYYEI